jgi:hypothetical protein
MVQELDLVEGDDPFTSVARGSAVSLLSQFAESPVGVLSRIGADSRLLVPLCALQDYLEDARSRPTLPPPVDLRGERAKRASADTDDRHLHE